MTLLRLIIQRETLVKMLAQSESRLAGAFNKFAFISRRRFIIRVDYFSINRRQRRVKPSHTDLMFFFPPHLTLSRRQDNDSLNKKNAHPIKLIRASLKRMERKL